MTFYSYNIIGLCNRDVIVSLSYFKSSQLTSLDNHFNYIKSLIFFPVTFSGIYLIHTYIFLYVINIILFFDFIIKSSHLN